MITDAARGLSLRERKKLATRAAISRAALRLAVERGPGNVLIEDIAAAAGVAPRTVNNYFPSKEAAIMAQGPDRVARLRALLESRPPDEPLWTALRQAVVELYTEHGEPDRQWTTRARLVKASPSLQGEARKADAAVQDLLAAEIAQRTGTDLRRDLYPRLAAAALISAVHAALDHWLEAGPPTSIGVVLDQALGQLAAGLAPPGRQRSRRPP